MPSLSIVLCTYNNADSLRKTLYQISQCKLPSGHDFELLVIDNNSPDNTREIFDGIAHSIPFSTTYLFEKRQGLSHARNTGLSSAKGEYILFTDDDAEIPENWISDYVEALLKYTPDCVYSRINIIWDKNKPWWFTHHYQPYFVHLDYGDNEQVVTDYHKEFYGKNFCVRKSILNEIGGFNPELGRQGDKLLAGEETVIYRKLIDLHKKVVYIPSPMVGHRLKAREYESSNIEKLYIDGASSNYALAKIFSQNTFFGRPIYPLINAIKLLLTHTPKLILSIKNRKMRYYHLLNIKQSSLTIKLWCLNR
tara:strand:+ start:333 stop:1256 length:924 start_codon:yes stop_codon:yes gene_type:complete